MLAATLLILTTGCTAAVSGSARTAPDGGTVLGKELGDVLSVDGCSFLHDDAFASLEDHAELRGVTPGYRSCAAGVKLRGAGTSSTGTQSIDISLDVYRGLHTASDYEKFHKKKASFHKTEVRGFEVFEGKTRPYRDKKRYACQRGITVGNHSVSVEAIPPKHTSVDVCRVADAAMNSAISTLQQGKVGHADVPRNSPARKDLCRTLDKPVKQVLGGQAKPKHGKLLSQCRWRASDHSTASAIVIAAAWPPALVKDPYYGFKKTSVGGKKTYCAAEKRHGRLGETCLVEYGAAPLGAGSTVLLVDLFKDPLKSIGKKLKRYIEGTLAALQD